MPSRDPEKRSETQENAVLQAFPAWSLSAAQLGPALGKSMSSSVKGPCCIARTLLQGPFKMLIQCVHGGYNLYFFVLLLYSNSIFVYWKEREDFLK